MLFFYPLFLFSRYFWILIFAQVWWKGKENLLKHPNSLFFSFYPWQHCSSSAAGLMEHAGPTSSLNKDAFWCFPIAHSVGSPPSLFSPLCSFLGDCQLVLLFICALDLHHFGAHPAPTNWAGKDMLLWGEGWALAAVAEGLYVLFQLWNELFDN